MIFLLVLDIKYLFQLVYLILFLTTFFYLVVCAVEDFLLHDMHTLVVSAEQHHTSARLKQVGLNQYTGFKSNSSGIPYV